MKITGAPGCWGIEDPNNKDNPHWSLILDEASGAGYKGIELGPYGYLPTDPDVLNLELQQRGLTICAGTMYDNLSSNDNFDYLMDKTNNICKLISQLRKDETDQELKYKPPYLVVIDEVNPIRSPLAGITEEAPRLGTAQWDCMMFNIRAISNMAWNEFGIRAVLHPHAGGYIEFADEILKALQDLSPELIGLCLDTGHLHYSGMDPLTWLQDHRDRLEYIHFKDINQTLYIEETKKHTGFFEACAKGVMCPIGKGVIDYKAILEYLKKIEYQGYITIEQERDPKDAGTSLQDVKASIEYLRNLGY